MPRMPGKRLQLPNPRRGITRPMAVKTYLGKLDGFKLYCVKNGFVPPQTGVSIKLATVDTDGWELIKKELKRKPNILDIYLNEDQTESLLKWAKIDANRCKECKGSGKYIGLMKVEDCLECNGKGYL